MAEALRADCSDDVLELPRFGVTFALGEVVVGMTEFKGRLIIATSNDIYEVIGKRLVKLNLQRFDEDA